MKQILWLLMFQTAVAVGQNSELSDAFDRLDQVNKAGTQSQVCPDGTCDFAHVGRDDGSTIACDAINSGTSLKRISNSSQLMDAASALVDWRAEAMSKPEKCKGSCGTGSAKLAQICSKMRNCSTTCNTSSIIDSVFAKGCSKGGHGPDYDKKCFKAGGCSPVDGIGKEDRAKILLAKYKGAADDIAKYHPDIDKKLKGKLKELPYWMTCLNQMRENTDIEPMERNYDRRCSYTAIGIGQVIEDTFWRTMGLRKATAKKCAATKIADLASCNGIGRRGKSVSSLNYYEGLFKEKYGELTVQEFFERRTFDLDLQARTSMATMINHMRDVGFNFDKGMTGYFGKKDQAAINRIRSCVNKRNGSVGV